MGFLSFFTFCVRLRCVLFFSCTIKVPFLIVHCVTPQTKQQPPYMYTSLPSEVNNLPRFRTQNMPRNASTTGFFSPPNINKGILISCCYL